MANLSINSKDQDLSNWAEAAWLAARFLISDDGAPVSWKVAFDFLWNGRLIKGNSDDIYHDYKGTSEFFLEHWIAGKHYDALEKANKQPALSEYELERIQAKWLYDDLTAYKAGKAVSADTQEVLSLIAEIRRLRARLNETHSRGD